jgi:hypothetical protein
VATADKTVTYLSYVHDPQPNDDWFELVLVFLIGEGGQVRVEEDRHRCGLFAMERWAAMLAAAGFEVDAEEEEEGHPSSLFFCIKR